MTCAPHAAPSPLPSPPALYFDAVEEQPAVTPCGPVAAPASCCAKAPVASCSPKALPAPSDSLSLPAPTPAPQATRDLREARLQLAGLAPRLAAAPAPGAPPAPGRADVPSPPSASGTMAALAHVPQYDRTHVPGCVCKPALAGGACCPGNVGGMTLQQMSGPSCGSGTGLQAAGYLAVGLGLAGIYSGMQVLRDARAALKNLHAVADHARRQEAEASVWRQQLAGYPKLAAAHAHAQACQTSLALLQRDLRLAIREQHFYRWMPGRLQIAAAVGVVVSAAHHQLGLGLSAVAGALLGASSSALFVLYGLAMAGKNLRAWHAGRAVPLAATPQGASPGYGRAVMAQRAEAVAQALRTGVAWLGVAAAGTLSCAVTLGFVVLPHAWAITGAVSLAAGVAAMWSNSCSRYAPHLPVSPHMQRQALVTTAQRDALYTQLQGQQALILAANAEFAKDLSTAARLRHLWEQNLAPQCGAESFQVLARAVAARASGPIAPGAPPEAPPAPSRDQAAQLTAVTGYLRHERAIWHARHLAAAAELTRRARELAPLVDPGCSTMRATAQRALEEGAPTQAVYSRAAHELQADARSLAHAARTLGVIDALLATCATLAPHVGALAATEPLSLSPHQRDWLEVRLNVLQLGGLLRDSMDTAFVAAHGHMLKSRGAAEHWPLGNLYAMPDQFDALATAMAPHMEAGFVHAFFNPRRIEAEMDYLLQMEATAMAAGPVGAARQSALAGPPAADFGASVATCCS